MIAQKASKTIEQAVCYELQNVVKEYGATYASAHEAYAVLKEEIEEAAEAQKEMESRLDVIWEGVKRNWVTNIDIYQTKEWALALAEEAVQCAAVCEKFLETVQGKVTIINTEDPPEVKKQLNPDAEDINSK